MTFQVDVVLKGRDVAVTEAVSVPLGEPSSWDDAAVRDVIVEILRAIDRAEHPDAPADRLVSLRGFSWIVEPTDGTPGSSGPRPVVIAIEIPMGAAVAGPFAVEQAGLDRKIRRVIAAASPHKPVVH